LNQLSEAEILRFLVELCALLVASRLLGDLAKRVGQAPVIGELLAGILLGPSMLGRISPALYAYLFTSGPFHGGLIEVFSWVGAIVLLLYIGLETDMNLLRGMGRTVVMVSGFGVAIPFACGLALGAMLPAHYMVSPDGRVIFALFIAVAMSISAVPVIAKILIDLGVMRRELGMAILAGGILDDTIGWLLLSLVAGLASHGRIDFLSTSLLIIEAAAFLAFCYYIGFRLVVRLLRWVDDRAAIEHSKFTAMVSLAFICAIITQAIGIHAVFGAFIAGVMLTGSARIRKDERGDLEALALGFMGPIFFAFSGLQANLSALREPIVPILVLAVAVLSKLVGCSLGGRLGGLHWREALTVALGMNARGGMGIIVALVGLNLHVLTPEMYTVLLLLAVATSVMTPPLLKWSLRSVSERPGEAERLERDKILSRIPFSKTGAKLLVLSGGGPNAELAAHLAACLGNHHDASMTVFHALRADDSTPSPEFSEQFATIKSIAELGGAHNVIQRTGAAESVAQAVVQEEMRGYDAIFAGASQLTNRTSLGGEVLREIMMAARTPVVVARSVGSAMPFRRVLVPVTGAPFSRFGATVAMLYALSTGAEVTALYVREVSRLTRFYDRRPLPEGNRFVDEIRVLGEQLGVPVETRVDEGIRPENVIVRVAETGKFDLLVMGALYRSANERLYFGPRVEQILEKAPCAVAVAVPPEQSFMRN
jgi:Kef-type K+ transport system membrane component KefB/nucleotide-binding universal stress UspA family protein